jgi:hypothetical protein
MPRPFSKRTLLFFFLAVPLLGLGGKASRLWAGEDASSSSPQGGESHYWDSDDDMELDLGMDDDKSDESTEKSKFKDDPDDTYEDSSADQDDQDKSKFKDDRDEEDDRDQADEGKNGG